MASNRRGFLKAMAALLPAAALTSAAEGATTNEQERLSQKKLRKDPKLKPGGSATVPPVEAKVVSSSIQLSPLDQALNRTNLRFFCDDVVAKGSVVELADMHPGVSGETFPVVRPGYHSGQPMGVILNDVVNKDLTRCHLNWNSGEVQVGGKVSICQEGWLTIGSFDNHVKAGSIIYYDKEGLPTTRDTGRSIGRAMSSSDADGFVQVRVQLYLNESAKLS